MQADNELEPVAALCFPATQSSHEAKPTLGANVPAGHASHVVAAAAPANRPSAQYSQPVEESESRSEVPVGQVSQWLAPVSTAAAVVARPLHQHKRRFEEPGELLQDTPLLEER